MSGAHVLSFGAAECDAVLELKRVVCRCVAEL